ncbi:MAG: leucine-rich repeat domain-containing protein [Paludibacteraceae bacterium]
MKWKGNIASSFSGGDGTNKQPYQISNGEELAYLASEVNNGNDYGESFFVLTNNIDLNGIDWIPIGNGLFERHTYKTIYENCSFRGVFDGNGYVINNLIITKCKDKAIGLFGFVGDGAVFMNINIVDVHIFSSDYQSNSGGLIGISESGAIVVNCKVNGKIQAREYSGGLIGSIKNGIVVNCHTKVEEVISGVGNRVGAGGLIGQADSTKIIACSSECEVKDSQNIGGLVGFLYGSEIDSCFAIGNINGERAGGIVGYSHSSKIWNSYSVSNVNGNEFAGNIAGYTNGGGEIVNCISAGNVSGKYTGNIVGCWDPPKLVNNYSENSKNDSTYSNNGAKIVASEKNTIQQQIEPFIHWSFDTIWKFTKGDKFPRFKSTIKVINDCGEMIFYSSDRRILLKYSARIKKDYYQILQGCKIIEKYAFKYSYLQTVHIPDSVTIIKDGAFYWCQNLQNINVPQNVKIIGQDVFDGCKYLRDVEIPQNKSSVQDVFSWLTINRDNGVLFCNNNFFFCSQFVAGLAIILKRINGSYYSGVVNEKGKIVIPPQEHKNRENYIDFRYKKSFTIWARKNKYPLILTDDCLYDNFGNAISKFNCYYKEIKILSDDRIMAKLDYYSNRGQETFILDDKGEIIINGKGEGDYRSSEHYYNNIELKGQFFLIIGNKNRKPFTICDYNGVKLFYIRITLSHKENIYFVLDMTEEYKNRKYGIIKFNDTWSKYDVLLPFLYNIVGMGTGEGEYVETEDGVDFNEEYVYYLKNTIGKCGAVNKLGGTTIPFEFDKIICIANNNREYRDYNESEYQSLITIDSSLYLVEKNEKRGLLNGKGEEILPVIFDKIVRMANSVYLVKYGEEYGCYNESGLEIIPVIYNKILKNKYSESHPIVLDNKQQMGVYSLEGNVIVPVEYKSIFPINYNTYLVKNNKSQWGMYSGNKGVALDCIFDRLLPSQKYDANSIRAFKANKCGLYSTEGNEIIAMEYEHIIDFYGSKLYAVKKNSRWTFLDKESLEKTVNYQYDRVVAYVNDCYLVRKNNEWILMNEEGFEVERDVTSIRIEERYGDFIDYVINENGILIEESRNSSCDVDYTQSELDGMYKGAFDGNENAYWNID